MIAETTHPTGPAVGTLFPDFTLPDQHGQQVTFSTARAGRKAIVTFIRSTDW